MNKIGTIFLLFPFLLQAQDADLFSLTNTAKYARYLLNAGDYSQAIPELNRLVFFDGENLEYQFQLINCYRHTYNYSLAIKRMDALFSGFNNMPERFAKEYITCNILDENYDHTISLLSGSVENNLEYKPFYLSYSYIMTEQYYKAEDLLAQSSNTWDPEIRLKASLKAYRDEKAKKPAVAFALSSIIPGSGKIYTGNWKDGLMAFSFVAISAWQSYRGFKKNGVTSVYGWAYGVASLSFYIGNLYGSVKAANVYNVRKREIFQENAQDIFMRAVY